MGDRYLYCNCRIGGHANEALCQDWKAVVDDHLGTRSVTYAIESDVITLGMEERLTKVKEIAYVAAKLGGKVPIFNLVEEVLMNFIHNCQLNTHLVKDMFALKTWDHSMNASMQDIGLKKSLITPVTTLIKRGRKRGPATTIWKWDSRSTFKFMMR